MKHTITYYSLNNPQHSLHNKIEHPHTPKNIIAKSGTHYHTQMLFIPPWSYTFTILRKHNHSHIIQYTTPSKYPNNTQMFARPPDIHSLSLLDRVHLAKLWCTHHPALLGNQRRVDEVIKDVYLGCNIANSKLFNTEKVCNARKKEHLPTQHSFHEDPVWKSG